MKAVIFYRVLVFFSIILLFGCSNNSKRPIVKIGFSQCISSDNWRKELNNGILTEAALIRDHHVKVIYKDAEGNTNKQIDQIRSLMNSDIDVLIVSPNESEPFSEVLNEVNKRGIPVVVVDREVDSKYFDAFIGSNNILVGKLAGELGYSFIRDIKNPKILTITGLESSSPAKDRQRGFLEVLKNKNLSIEVIKANWKKNKAHQVLDSLLLVSNKHFDLVFAHNDEMAEAASEIFLNPNDKPFIIGVDGLSSNNGGLEMIINGQIDGSVYYPPSGEKALRLAYDLYLNKKVKKYNYQKTFQIDKLNAGGLLHQALRVKEEQSKLKSLMANYDSVVLDIKEKNQFIFWGAILVSLLFVSLWSTGYLVYQKNKVNKLLIQQQTEINHQNREIKSNRDQLISVVKQMEEVVEVKTQFFSNISHEFKNLICLMSIDVERELEDHEVGVRLKNYIAMLNSNLNRLLSHNILDNMEYNVSLKYGDLSRAIQEIVETYKSAGKTNGIDFKTNIESVFLEFDFDVIQKVVSNLLSNAFKYTNKGTVELILTKEDDFAVILVKDTGIGIPKEEQEQVFDRYKKSSISSETVNSYGIGLSFSRSLVQLSGGNISLKSVPNVGSVFKVQLPLMEEKQLNKSDKLTKKHHENSPTILLVDDNVKILNRIKDVLSEYYNVITASNGKEAYKLATYHYPNLIISDILMPEMDGVQLSQKLFENPSTIHIPIILLTAIQGEGIRIKGYQIGVSAFLTKPFSSKTLLARVGNLLDHVKEKNKSIDVEFVAGDTKSDHDQIFIKKVNDLLYSQMSNFDFKIDDIIGEVGMSRSKFYRKIKEITGSSPNEYLRKIKLEYASQVLIKSDFSISEISYNVGFSDVKYFSKLFQKQFELTPTDYRQKFNNVK